MFINYPNSHRAMFVNHPLILFWYYEVFFFEIDKCDAVTFLNILLFKHYNLYKYIFNVSNILKFNLSLDYIIKLLI